MPEGYQEIAACSRRNGAWLVSLYLNDVSQDFGHHEMSDCAGSLAKAKSVARYMAEDWISGCRWEQRTDTEWVMWARLVEFEEAY